MRVMWRWLAGIGAALAALLAALWGLTHWGRERERRQRELDRSIEKEAQRLSEAEAKLAREAERGQAALAESRRAVVDSSRDGAGPERLAGWLRDGEPPED